MDKPFDRVVMVGCGKLGAQLALAVAEIATRIGHPRLVDLVDPDTVDDRPKVYRLRRNLRVHGPGMRVRAWHASYEDAHDSLFPGRSPQRALILCATDSANPIAYMLRRWRRAPKRHSLHRALVFGGMRPSGSDKGILSVMALTPRQCISGQLAIFDALWQRGVVTVPSDATCDPQFALAAVRSAYELLEAAIENRMDSFPPLYYTVKVDRMVRPAKRKLPEMVNGWNC